MAEEVRRGDIWMLERPAPDKRRPVLVLSRPSLIQVLHTVTVVAITSTRRGAPIEVPLGVDEGLKHPSCANLANLFTVRRADLRRYVGSASQETMRAVCRALVLAAGCDC
ncbi:MAG TPA: type II toxin-antitoxin system PemK/MazF family toxin [Polyangiaceae bacterium]